MKLAIIGSRNLHVENLSDYIPEGVTEIISGGAHGIDSCAREFAVQNGIRLTEFLPDYRRYGRGAPLKRNILIVDTTDEVLAFWDGNSRGTAYTISYAREKSKNVRVIML